MATAPRPSVVLARPGVDVAPPAPEGRRFRRARHGVDLDVHIRARAAGVVVAYILSGGAISMDFLTGDAFGPGTEVGSDRDRQRS
jgi:hypothetical protein